jgi:elongation factor Ts
MATASLENIKTLRDSTGLSIMACKKALSDSNDDLKKALDVLRKQGATKASKLADRTTKQGVVTSYIHNNNKLGVLVKIECETDFAAKSGDFVNFGKDVAMQIAASNPIFITPDQVSEEIVNKEREIWIEQLKNEKKPENIIENILKGKEKKYREEISLLSQPFIKNPEITIEDLLKELIAKLGENIKISDFKRISF